MDLTNNLPPTGVLVLFSLGILSVMVLILKEPITDFVRRFRLQFRLRTLLWLMVTICFVLAVSRVAWEYPLALWLLVLGPVACRLCIWVCEPWLRRLGVLQRQVEVDAYRADRTADPSAPDDPSRPRPQRWWLKRRTPTRQIDRFTLRGDF